VNLIGRLSAQNTKICCAATKWKTDIEVIYKALYPILRFLLWLVMSTLPVEAFNKLCLILPGRLISYGLRYYGARIGEDTTFTAPVVFHNFANEAAKPFANLRVGKNCYFGRAVFFDIKDEIVVEDNATLAMGVMILTHTDVAHSPLKDARLASTTAPVTIGEGAYLAARATVLQSVNIGECAVIAAGAVVTDSVPAYKVYGGVPARPLAAVVDVS
jgi:acetyltransferase-like isoleucine patch superfamily enzyme